jgi:hypothetical protein
MGAWGGRSFVSERCELGAIKVNEIHQRVEVNAVVKFPIESHLRLSPSPFCIRISLCLSAAYFWPAQTFLFFLIYHSSNINIFPFYTDPNISLCNGRQFLLFQIVIRSLDLTPEDSQRRPSRSRKRPTFTRLSCVGTSPTERRNPVERRRKRALQSFLGSKILVRIGAGRGQSKIHDWNQTPVQSPIRRAC